MNILRLDFVAFFSLLLGDNDSKNAVAPVVPELPGSAGGGRPSTDAGEPGEPGDLGGPAAAFSAACWWNAFAKSSSIPR